MKKEFLILIIVIYLLPFSVNAQRGCCSHHGGVASCGANGKFICNDGTYSKTCTCTPAVIYGCTDWKAKNYNVNATQDDGSCLYEIKGCTNKEAINYNASANTEDGSCLFEKIKEEKQIIPFETEKEEISENSLEKVIQNGKDGVKLVKIKETLNEQNQVVKNEIIEEKVLVEPVKEIIKQEKKTSTKEKVEEDQSIIPALIYSLFFAFGVYIQNKSSKKTLLNQIKELKVKSIRYCCYVFYFLLIFPIFIDLIVCFWPQYVKRI